ncbi:MAG: Hint domain-containing protein [Pseudomonadota bacterium]
MALISELHYSNAYANATGVSEFLEVTLLLGEDPADFTVSFYQSSGNVGIEINLTDPGVQATTDPDTGRTYYVISEDDFPILLTDPDGGGATNYEAYALTDIGADPDQLLSFYDIGGGTANITANDGLAAGQVSTNIPVPTGPNAATYTIQFRPAAPDEPILVAVTEGGPPPCFAAGTRIRTVRGPAKVEDLCPGTMIATADGGHAVLRKVLSRQLSGAELRAASNLWPVRITAGALGGGLPTRDLCVSRQHRMLVRSKIAKRMFGSAEVLIAAHQLTALPGIDLLQPKQSITYFHLLFDCHQVIFAEDAPSESLYLGPEALKSIHPDAREEILAIFPQFATSAQTPEPARPLPIGRLQSQLIARHVKNDKPVLQSPRAEPSLRAVRL